MTDIIDSRFNVQVVSASSNPQLLSWDAAHRDYSEELSTQDLPPTYRPKTEEEAGKKLIGLILNKGHFGVLEHAHITLECSGFPHEVAMQARTHRVPFSFDVQSQRYTGKRVLKLVDNHSALLDDKEKYRDYLNYMSVECKEPSNPAVQENIQLLKDIFYIRPPGTYVDRLGKKFVIDESIYRSSYADLLETAYAYEIRINEHGWSEEVARNVLGQGIRQGFFMTTNIRGLMHFLDMRAKKDAQLEIRNLCSLLQEQFASWCPEIANWYYEKRYAKNKLAP